MKAWTFWFLALAAATLLFMPRASSRREMRAGNDTYETAETIAIERIRAERAEVCAENPRCPFVRQPIIKPSVKKDGTLVYDGTICDRGYFIAFLEDGVVCVDSRIQPYIFAIYGDAKATPCEIKNGYYAGMNRPAFP